jgi:tetratricopeptide (TPR) repeat protein
MATFFLDRYSKENSISQWTKHLQTEAYISDVDDIISRNRRELETTMRSASSEQIKAINHVCGKLDDGFNEVSRYLKDIDSNISGLRGEISEMASMLDWRLSMVIEEQRVTNQLLGNIAVLLRIPDSQKQRVYYIERGLKYLKNAYLEDIHSSFYSDALESFRDAEKIERKDYITLNRLGQIFLYSKKNMDIPLAEQYFLKSAREAIVESNAGGTTTSNNLNPYGYNLTIYSENPFKVAAAEAYLYASRACYLQDKLDDAIELAGKSYKLIPEFLEAGFEQAKYLAAGNQVDKAVTVLETVINKDRYFSIKTLNDKDLSSKQEVLSFLEGLQQKAILKAKEKMDECTAFLIPNSKAKELIIEIESNVSKNTFLSGMKALDILEKDYKMEYEEFIPAITEIHRRVVSPVLKINQFVKRERFSAVHFDDVKQKVKREIVSTYTIQYAYGAGAIGLVIGFFKGCSLKTFSEDWGTFFATLAIFGILGVIIGLIVASGKEPKVVNAHYNSDVWAKANSQE